MAENEQQQFQSDHPNAFEQTSLLPLAFKISKLDIQDLQQFQLYAEKFSAGTQASEMAEAKASLTKNDEKNRNGVSRIIALNAEKQIEEQIAQANAELEEDQEELDENLDNAQHNGERIGNRVDDVAVSLGTMAVSNSGANTSLATSQAAASSALLEAQESANATRTDLINQRDALAVKLEQIPPKNGRARLNFLNNHRQEIRETMGTMEQHGRQLNVLEKAASILEEANSPDSNLTPNQVIRVNNSVAATVSYTKNLSLDNTELDDLKRKFADMGVDNPFYERVVFLAVESGATVEGENGMDVRGHAATCRISDRVRSEPDTMEAKNSSFADTLDGKKEQHQTSDTPAINIQGNFASHGGAKFKADTDNTGTGDTGNVKLDLLATLEDIVPPEGEHTTQPKEPENGDVTINAGIKTPEELI